MMDDPELVELFENELMLMAINCDVNGKRMATLKIPYVKRKDFQKVCRQRELKMICILTIETMKSSKKYLFPPIVKM